MRGVLAVNGLQKHDRAVERGEREIGQNHGWRGLQKSKLVYTPLSLRDWQGFAPTPQMFDELIKSCSKSALIDL